MSSGKTFLKSILFGIPLTLTFIDKVGYIARVDGKSMQPLLNPSNRSDYIFLCRWSLSNIVRGEVISFISPKNPEHRFIKRVIGIPGDHIDSPRRDDVVIVPEGHCWVEGDHTGHSMDSNHFGPVSLGLVTAKATAIVWPPSRWQFIEPELRYERLPRNLLPLNGNIHQNALTLGDIDNDGSNELVVGNTSGSLFIYKEQNCVQTIDKLGMITAVGVGDVLNCDSNALVVISGEGCCYIYLCLSSQCEGDCITAEASPFKLQPVHVQRIPANTKALLIGDIDKDGNLELVIALTDRVVRSYRWTQNCEGGKLVCLNKWECANQIGNLTLSYDTDHEPCLLISQPGATFMRIRCQTDYKNNSDKLIVDYVPLLSKKLRNLNISSEILGNLRMGDERDNGMMYAVATLDGHLMLVKDEEIIWSLQVDQQLFALCKLDMTNDGKEELIASTWEGYTYILDENKHAVRFQTEEPVSGFCAGHYKLSSKEPAVPCLVYSTFTNKIQIYYDAHFTDITVKNLFQVIEEEPESEAYQLYQKFTGHLDSAQKREFFRGLLYGNHNLREEKK